MLDHPTNFFWVHFQLMALLMCIWLILKAKQIIYVNIVFFWFPFLSIVAECLIKIWLKNTARLPMVIGYTDFIVFLVILIFWRIKNALSREDAI